MTLAELRAEANLTERWIPVVGYEGYYEVSSNGRVRGVDRVVPGRDGRVTRLAGCIKKQIVNRGYFYVSLCRDRRSHPFAVHRLVTLAFLGPRTEGTEVCHNNGERFDNRVENLRYDTHIANMADAARHHVHHNAAKTHCKRGHEFTDENTRIEGLGQRRCLACERARRKAAA